MSYSFFDGSVLLAQDALDSLANILKKAQEHTHAANLPSARLCDDMLPLTFQVYKVTSTCQEIVAYLSNEKPATFENNLTSWDDINARLAAAKEVLKKADKDLINSRVDEVITINLGSHGTADMSGKAYVVGFSMPNLFFHLTTAYGIVRKEGVPLEKLDYLGSFIGKYISQ